MFMNIWHDIDASRITENRFETLIEIPKGSKTKYELDKETGLLRLDRVLYTSTVYPANYGFIPHTLADDGDPLDVLVLCNESIFPMTLVTCMPIGVIKMVDGDELDEKIIAVPVNDPNGARAQGHGCQRDMPQVRGYRDNPQVSCKLRRKIRQTAAVISAAVRRIKIALFATKYK